MIATLESPAATKVKTVSLYRAQYDFHHCPSPYKAFVAGIGCVAGDTRVNGIPIAERKSSEMVRTIGGSAKATSAFLKGRADLYRVRTVSGLEVTVTLSHRFLTPVGWRQLRDLAVGDAIGSDENWREAESKGRESDCQGRYSPGSRPGGELSIVGGPVALDILPQLRRTVFGSNALGPYTPLSTVGSCCQTEAPHVGVPRYWSGVSCERLQGPHCNLGQSSGTTLQIDSEILSPEEAGQSLGGDPFLPLSPVSAECETRTTDACLGYLLPNVGCQALPTDEGSPRNRAFAGCSPLCLPLTHCPAEFWRPYPAGSACPQPFCECSGASENSLAQDVRLHSCAYNSTNWEEIQAIDWQRVGDFYDITVPYWGHYSAHGLWHHNSGKSFAGAYDLIRRAKRDSLYMVGAPTYKQLKDSSMRTLVGLAKDLGYFRDLSKADMVLTLGNGSEVLLRSTDDPDSLRGPNLSGVWLDEATLMPHEAYTIAIGRLREHGRQGWLSVTGTPKGKRHWTYKVFGPKEDGSPKEGVAVFTARTRDNPFLPTDFDAKLREQYTSALALQELDAQWLDLEGAVANRNWFGVAAQKPKATRYVRFWDIAASVKDVHNEDPDYTVGALLSYVHMVYYVEDIVRGRWTPGEVENMIRRTARADGRHVTIGIEQEPGSAGKIAAHDMLRKLAGYTVRLVKNTGDKLTRAMPFLAQAEHGSVKLIRGKWNDPFLDEVADFPVGSHDDQVDAVAGAFQLLTAHATVGRIQVKMG